MINQAEQLLDGGLVREVKRSRDDLDALKGKQRIGADSVQVSSSNLLEINYGNVPGNIKVITAISVTPSTPRLSIYNYALSVFSDGLSSQANRRFPNSDAAVGAPNALRLFHWLDWAASNDTTGMRLYQIIIENYDSGPHLIILDFKAYSIYNPAGGAL